MKKILLSLGVVVVAVSSASAQQVLTNVDNIVKKMSDILSGGVASSLMAVVFIAFMATIINFLIKRAKGDDKGFDDAKNMLGWSVIGMFVMVAVWGLVTFLSQTIGVGLGGQVARPDPIPKEKTGLKSSGSACTNGFECISSKCAVESDGKGICN